MKNFTEFLKDPKNEPVLNSILRYFSYNVSFLKEAKKLKHFTEVAHFSEKFQTFITEQSKLIQQTWNGKYNPKELSQLEQALEAMLTRSFSSLIFPILTNGDPISRTVDLRVTALKEEIKLKNLDIPDALVDEKTLSVAADQFRKIQNYSTPKNKINIIINFCKILSYMVQKGAEKVATAQEGGTGVHAGADQFFPVLVYALFYCGVEQLGAHASFIKFFRHQPKLDSQDEYYFVTFSCALSFIKDMKPSDVHMQVEEFESLLKNPPKTPEKLNNELVPASLEKSSNFEELKQQSALPSHFESTVAQSVVTASTCFETSRKEQSKFKSQNKSPDKNRTNALSNQVEHHQDEVKSLVQRPFETLTVSELRLMYDFLKSSFE